MTPRTVALIYPPTNAVTVMPSLGLGYLAGSLLKAGFPVEIYDLSRRHIKLNELFKKLSETRPAVIGLSVSTPNAGNAATVAKLIRRLPYRPTLILGGPHVSVYPDQALAEFSGDFVVLREGERSLVNLLFALENGGDVAKVRGVVHQKDDRIIRTEPEPAPPDLDALPWPAWDLIEPHKYPPIPHQLFVKDLPVAPILTTRGCPFDCPYCSSTRLFGARIRRRSPADVVDEMFYLVDKFGIREIHIEDDNPTLHRGHINALCREIISRERKVAWKFPNGIMVQTADESLLRLMKEAGCYQISLGIETVNEETELGKEVSLEKVLEITKLSRRIGLQTVGLFMMGMPNETDEMIRRTIRQSRRMSLDFAHFGIYIPLPGSRWGDEISKAATELSDLNFFSAPRGPIREARKIKGFQRNATLKFYLRPRNFFRLLSMIKPRQIPGFLTTFRRYVF